MDAFMAPILAALVEMFNLPLDAAEAANFVWLTALSIGVVVSAVVSLLLWLINLEAGRINARVSKIWDVGQTVANNTIHIPTLYRINENVDEILATAVQIIDGAKGIEVHANGCPGCPHCMLES